jgi:hypothetical protein
MRVAKMARMTELDELERALLEQAAMWFPAPAHRQLQRLIEIARNGEKARLANRVQAVETPVLNIEELHSFAPTTL